MTQAKTEIEDNREQTSYPYFVVTFAQSPSVFRTIYPNKKDPTKLCQSFTKSDITQLAQSLNAGQRFSILDDPYNANANDNSVDS